MRSLKKFHLNKKRLILLDLILAACAVFLVFTYWLLPTRVEVTYKTLSGTKDMIVRTRAATLAGVAAQLHKEGLLTLTNLDRVSPAESTLVKSGMKCTVLKGEESDILLAGKKTPIVRYPGTVEENLKYNGVTYDQDDVVTPALNTQMTYQTAVRVDQVKIVTLDKTETVKPQTGLVTLTKTLSSGTVRKVDGAAGQAVYTYTEKYVNGKKTQQTKKLKKWIKEKKDDELQLGTSATGQTGQVKVTRTFTGNCTAYYMGETAVGAAGSRCHYGTCAVDPSVIPYGTRLYITGYGFAVANDCGGAVKGNVVDLYMRSTGEALRWGRRHVKVYVLG